MFVTVALAEDIISCCISNSVFEKKSRKILSYLTLQLLKINYKILWLDAQSDQKSKLVLSNSLM